VFVGMVVGNILSGIVAITWAGYLHNRMDKMPMIDLPIESVAPGVAAID
jgi:uncharacterized membrane protein